MELKGEKQQRLYVDELADAIRSARMPPLVPVDKPGHDGLLADWVATMARAQRAGESRHLVPAELTETSLRESRLDASAPTTGPALRAVDRLVDWATDARSGAPRLCALLGDVGMGKTTTAKLFTRRLLDLRAQGRSVPLPILFDLRDVRITGLVASMTLDTILDCMLDATRPAGVPRERLCAEVVRTRLATGDAVVIFDGLDEVLVHLGPHDQQLFARQLWRAVDERADARMLLTCRTQYFRTIRDQTTYFTGESRQSLRGNDYLALLMLPFRDEQVREYLIANLGRDAAAVDAFLKTIAAVHNLPELTRRPMTLRLIADQVEFIETAKLAGRELRAVDLYGEVVDRWLGRDSGKHTLIPEHKTLLMEEIAAELWRSGKNSWTANEVDDWLLALLDRRPDVRRHYRDHVPDLWKADFRTATFLKRDDDAFAFGHRSLFEYFLARYLLRVLVDAAPDINVLAMPVPSAETLDFLGQSIAGAPRPERRAALAGLAMVGRRYVPQVSELVFTYALRSAERGHPHQSLAGVQMARAQLPNLLIGSPEQGGLVAMTGADLSEANLRHTRFYSVDLSGADLRDADLTNAELHGCRMTSVRMDRAKAVGAILRRCSLDETPIGRVEAYRTQLLLCSPAPEQTDGLLVAPASTVPEVDGARLRELAGRVDLFNAVAWSAATSRLATGSGDGAIGIWDSVSGELLCQLGRHRSPVQAVAWSPDGTQLAIGSTSGAYILPVTTGVRGQRLTHHGSPVLAVAWSPDGTQLATGSVDGARIWRIATGTGRPVHRVIHCDGPVLAVDWSPDGTQLATGNPDGVRIWHAATGRPGRPLIGLTRLVGAVAWSPDGARLAAGSSDSMARIWETTTGEPLHELSGHTHSVGTVAWSPDGTELATGADGGARIWQTITGELRRQLSDHSGGLGTMAWSPDGTRLATVSIGGAGVWHIASGHLLHKLVGHSAGIGRTVWPPHSAKAIYGKISHAERVRTVALSSSPETSLTASGDDSVTRILETTRGRPLLQIIGSPDRALAWSADGTRLIVGGPDGARSHDDGAGRQFCQLPPHVRGCRTRAVSPTGLHLAANHDLDVTIWDIATGSLVRHLTGDPNLWSTLTWSPDGAQLAAGGIRGNVRVWDTLTDLSVGFTLTELPDSQVAVFDTTTGELVGASDGAWRWLGYVVVQLGQLTRLPAETFGHLPPLRSIGPTAPFLIDDVENTVISVDTTAQPGSTLAEPSSGEMWLSTWSR